MPLNFQARITFTEESRRKIDGLIEGRRLIYEGQRQVQAAIEEFKQLLQRSIAAISSATGDDPNYKDYAEEVGSLGALLDEPLRKVVEYGFFDGVVYDFSDDYAEIQVQVECTEFPRLSASITPWLRYFNPEAKELTLRSWLYMTDDTEDRGPDYYVTFTLQLDEGLSFTASAGLQESE